MARHAGVAPEGTRQLLLEAATSEFADHGFHLANLTHIASRAGSTKPTIYAHFGGKETLYLASVQAEADRIRRTLFATYAATDGQKLPEQMRTGTLALFDYAIAHPAGFRLVFDQRSGDAPRDQVRRQLVADLVTQIATKLIEYRGQPLSPTAAQQLADLVVSACINGATKNMHAPPERLHAVGELTASLLTAGLTHLDSSLLQLR